MEIVTAIVGLLFVGGLGLWIWERRRGRDITIVDDTPADSSHADRERIRIESEITARTIGNQINH